ncbi:hypothetical protein ACYSNM_07245, partial [Myroides sp. LJL116]
MNKKLLSVACLMGAFSLYAQVGVGTLVPNKSAELAVISSERGLLIPNIALKDLTDAVTIKAGNIESLLVYNTNSTDVLSPGYYYWENNKWNRLLITEDIPQVVIDNFEEISQDVHVTNLIENIIRNTQGNVLYDDNKLYYIDKSKNQTTLLFSSDDFITILDYDSTTGILTYKNESNNLVSVDIKSAVKAFESVTKIVQNLNDNTIIFYDENGDSTTIDLKGFVKNAETVTTLVKDGPGKYTYTNEKDLQTKINVSGDLVDIIHGKLDLDLYNILKTFVKDHQSITRLFYNPTTRILNFTDENEQVFDFDLTQIVQDTQEKTRIDANASKNITVQSNVNGNTLTYTLEVKPATASSLGVVKPGSGLLVDQEGVLSVDLGAVMQGQDLKGNNKIVVTNGEGSVLKEVNLDIDESKLSLQNIGGILNLNQLFKGNKGDILIVDQNGDIVWSAIDVLTTNSLTLDNSSLVSKVNAIQSSVSLVDKISTEMLQGRAVTEDKLGATPAQNTMVGVVQADGSVKYQKLSQDNIESKLLQSANNLLTVTNGGESVLKDVTLSINQANYDLSLIGGKLNITQINPGSANTVLITNNNGELEWVNKTVISPEIIHNLSSAGNNMTSTINGVDKSAVIIAEVEHTLDGNNLTTSVNGIESNKINLASIDHTTKVVEGTNVQVIENIAGNEASYTVSVSDAAIQAAQKTTTVAAGVNITVAPTTSPDGKHTVYTISSASFTPDIDIQNGQIVTKVVEGTGIDVGYAASGDGKLHTYTVSVDPTQELLEGDVTGALNDNTVVAIQGIEVLEGTPADKQVLTYDVTANKWVPKTQSILEFTDGKALSSTDLDLSSDANVALLKDVTANIKSGAVTTVKLFDGAVTTAKIADNAVTTAKIADAGSDQVLVTNTSGEPIWENKSTLVTGNQKTSSVKAGTNVTVGTTVNGKDTEYLVNASISDTDIQSGQKTSSVKAGTNVTVGTTVNGKDTE